MGWLDRLIGWFVPSAPGPLPVAAPPAPGAVVAALNRARASVSLLRLAPLAEDPALSRLAASRAHAMAARGVLDHAGFAGEARAALPGAAALEECLAEGDLTAESLVGLWLGDMAHRGIVLGPYDRVGCAVARAAGGTAYWVADFALYRPLPPPSMLAPPPGGML